MHRVSHFPFLFAFATCVLHSTHFHPAVDGDDAIPQIGLNTHNTSNTSNNNRNGNKSQVKLSYSPDVLCREGPSRTIAAAAAATTHTPDTDTRGGDLQLLVAAVVVNKNDLNNSRG